MSISTRWALLWGKTGIISFEQENVRIYDSEFHSVQPVDSKSGTIQVLKCSSEYVCMDEVGRVRVARTYPRVFGCVGRECGRNEGDGGRDGSGGKEGKLNAGKVSVDLDRCQSERQTGGAVQWAGHQ